MNFFWKSIGIFLLGIGSLFAFFKGSQLNQWAQSQRQTIGATPKLLKSIGDVTTNQNLAELHQKQAALRETVSTLQAVPNLSGFDYTTAQAQIQQIHLKSALIFHFLYQYFEHRSEK